MHHKTEEPKQRHPSRHLPRLLSLLRLLSSKWNTEEVLGIAKTPTCPTAISIHKSNMPIDKDGCAGVRPSGSCYYLDPTSYSFQLAKFPFKGKLAPSVFRYGATVWLKVSTSLTSQVVSKDGHYCPLDLWLRSKQITFPLSFLQASVPARLIILYFHWRDAFGFFWTAWNDRSACKI